MKKTLVHINLFHPSSKKQDANWVYRQNPHSILVPRGVAPSIKTETHEVDPKEFLGKKQLENAMKNILNFCELQYLQSFEELKTYIEDNIDKEIITINLGIATHPETDYNGHGLTDWVRRLKHKFPNDFDKLKWRFANTWDIYGHQLDEWIPWFTESISAIDQKNISIEVANYSVSQQLTSTLPNANVMYNTVYFKRILRSNILNNNEPAKINTAKRTKHAMCLNHFSKLHRTRIVNLINNTCDKTKFYFSYISNNIKLEHDENLHLSNIDKWQDTPPESIINDCYVNIVTETFFFKDRLFSPFEDGSTITTTPFITEKTFKCAYYYQPMLIAGMQGSLKVFKELGFESFPEFFDESYDDIENDESRLNKINKEIFKLQSMPIETLHEIYHSPGMIKKLKHNKSVFNRFVREDPSMQYTKLHKLYEKPWIDIGLNPLLDEIYLDK